VEFLIPWLVVAALFVPLRWLERWLHQHMFKVGWLLTKNLHTTTILYYTFFLPGVVLHEVVYWLAAGILNVRAERAITWPEAQAIGELRLNFIRLSKNAGSFKVGLISAAPFAAGVLVIWVIANNILNLGDFIAAVQNGTVNDIPSALKMLTQAPDFFLWVYIGFTISNTMMPRFQHLKGLRILLIIIAASIALLYALGVAEQVLVSGMAEPMNAGLSLLAGAFTVMIAINTFMLGLLGATESIIERITGDSATFQNGKLVAMTREELRKLREQEEAKRVRQHNKKATAPAGPPSIYKLPLPIPDAPSKETLPGPETPPTKPEDKPPMPPGVTSEARAGASVITGTAVVKPDADKPPAAPKPPDKPA
jgi:hypothetical protein